MYPPTELYATIKSIKNNCKAKKQSQDPDLKYQVRLRHNEVELWTKHFGEQQYHRTDPTIFGTYITPKIDKITTLPNFGLSPPKGHDLNFKRPRENHDDSIRTPKRHQFLEEEISLVPGWQTPNTTPFQSTQPSPPKETPQNKLVQIMRDMTKPPTPIKTRSRSQSGA